MQQDAIKVAAELLAISDDGIHLSQEELTAVNEAIAQPEATTFEDRARYQALLTQLRQSLRAHQMAVAYCWHGHRHLTKTGNTVAWRGEPLKNIEELNGTTERLLANTFAKRCLHIESVLGIQPTKANVIDRWHLFAQFQSADDDALLYAEKLVAAFRTKEGMGLLTEWPNAFHIDGSGCLSDSITKERCSSGFEAINYFSRLYELERIAVPSPDVLREIACKVYENAKQLSHSEPELTAPSAL